MNEIINKTNHNVSASNLVLFKQKRQKKKIPLKISLKLDQISLIREGVEHKFDLDI